VASNFTGYQIVCPNVKSSAEEDAEWIPKTLQRIAALGNIHSPKLDHSVLLCLRVLRMHSPATLACILRVLQVHSPAVSLCYM
jgi:hypothetical protein